ncbi:hypothetical protein ACVW0K_007328 [Streptomyces filamentosus]
MHTTPQECRSALAHARAQARGLASTIAATLADMYPHTAYLVLSRCPDHHGLDLDSIRTASGAVLHMFEDLTEQLPVLTDPALHAAWEQSDPRDPHVLLHLLRDLDNLGMRFAPLPDSAQRRDAPPWDAPSLLCLVVNPEAPEPGDVVEQETTVTVALTVTEEVTYEFTAEVEVPEHLTRAPAALQEYLAHHEELWLDALDPLGEAVSVNERTLDEASLVLTA